MKKKQRSKDCVKVVIRCRPLTSKEQTKKEEEIVFVKSKNKQIFLKNPKKEKTDVFTFDFTFGQDCDQEKLYSRCCEGVINSLMDGYNCTIFAYGQTGTGKTYTMEGQQAEKV
jgi:kinesin family protein 3/17